MRRLGLTGCLLLLALYATEIRVEFDRWLDAETNTDPRIEAAATLRCSDEIPALRTHCAAELEQELASDLGSAEMILRRHCTRISNAWALEVRLPPAICSEFYGGWIEA